MGTDSAFCGRLCRAPFDEASRAGWAFGAQQCCARTRTRAGRG